MLSPVFLRAISTRGCCRLRAVFLYWHPHISCVSPGPCRGRRNSSIQGKAGPCAAERVLHSPSFTFYSDSSRSAGKDAEKNRKKWTKTLWLKHLKRGEINFLPRPVFSVSGLNMFSAILMVTAPRQDWVSKTNKTLCNWRPGPSLLFSG